MFPGTEGMIITSLKRTLACDCQSAELSFLILDKQVERKLSATVGCAEDCTFSCQVWPSLQ